MQNYNDRKIENINNKLITIIQQHGGEAFCEFEGEEQLFEFFNRGEYPNFINELIEETLELDMTIDELTTISEIWDYCLSIN